MSTLIFVILFIALGLGVLFMALSGGRDKGKSKGEGAERRTAKDRRNQKLAMTAFVLALLGLGIGIPAAVIGAVKARDSVPEANVSNLTAQEKRGRELFAEVCRNCHMLAASNTAAQVGPNLDQLRPPKSLVLDAINNGRARGNGQMAADLVEGEDAEAVAAYVAKAVGQTGQQP
jgi:mono/diheme cytochrome c family protein